MNCEKETRDGFLPPPASWREQTENRPLSPADYGSLSLFNMSSGSGEQEGVQNSAGFVGLQAAGFMEAVV